MSDRFLLAASSPDFTAHLAAHGPLPALPDVDALADLLDASSLAGRGGAAFPTGRKLRAVAAAKTKADRLRARPVVLANGSDGEPLSNKDAVLIDRAPHLILDGLRILAGALDPSLTAVRAPAVGLEALRRAAGERHDLPAISYSETTGDFIEGEATAAVRALAGAPRCRCTARGTSPRPATAGARGSSSTSRRSR